MTCCGDHLFRFNEEPFFDEVSGKWAWSPRTRHYDYDSAAGIVYAVDVTRPVGNRVDIFRMADGTSFDPAAEYKVAVNSYRGNGGGYHLTEGAGIEKPADRLIARTEGDLRHYLTESIRERGVVAPTPVGNWSVLPAGFAIAGMVRDYEILYGEPVPENIACFRFEVEDWETSPWPDSVSVDFDFVAHAP